MSALTIAARYPGTCPVCLEKWQPEDLIQRQELNELPASEPRPGRWRHVMCPDGVDELALKPGESVCTSCFLTTCDCQE